VTRRIRRERAAQCEEDVRSVAWHRLLRSTTAVAAGPADDSVDRKEFGSRVAQADPAVPVYPREIVLVMAKAVKDSICRSGATASVEGPR
jgi:hypothetical protein